MAYNFSKNKPTFNEINRQKQTPIKKLNWFQRLFKNC